MCGLMSKLGSSENYTFYVLRTYILAIMLTVLYIYKIKVTHVHFYMHVLYIVYIWYCVFVLVDMCGFLGQRGSSPFSENPKLTHKIHRASVECA